MFQRDIEKRPGELVRISIERYRQRERIDLRQYWTPQAAEDPVPTRQGVSLPIAQLPRLRALLQEAEEEALRAGLLDEEAYESCGLRLPHQLTA